MFLNALEKLGGEDWLVDHAEKCAPQIYACLARLFPRKLDVTADVNVSYEDFIREAAKRVQAEPKPALPEPPGEVVIDVPAREAVEECRQEARRRDPSIRST